jgi:hypothetical protein
MSERDLRRADIHSGKFARPSERQIHPGHEKKAALLASRIGIVAAPAAKQRTNCPAKSIEDGQGGCRQKLNKEKT